MFLGSARDWQLLTKMTDVEDSGYDSDKGDLSDQCSKESSCAC